MSDALELVLGVTVALAIITGEAWLVTRCGYGFFGWTSRVWEWLWCSSGKPGKEAR